MRILQSSVEKIRRADPPAIGKKIYKHSWKLRILTKILLLRQLLVS
jgi:hypothetical protein